MYKIQKNLKAFFYYFSEGTHSPYSYSIREKIFLTCTLKVSSDFSILEVFKKISLFFT